MSAESYAVDILIPTARVAFAVDGGDVVFMDEHRPPAAYRRYEELKDAHQVVGMTTFPNTVLLRGPVTVLVDPGLHLQNEPVVRALEERGLAVADIDLVALTHAHSDHAGACVDVERPVAVHVAETREPHWAAAAGVLERRELRLLKGEEGELAPGLRWARTPGHTEGGICLRVPTSAGEVVLAGDVIGPVPEPFIHLERPVDEPQAELLLAVYRLIRSWKPVQVIPGHLAPLAASAWRG